MKNFKILELKQFNDTSKYQKIESSIYKDLKDDHGFATYEGELTDIKKFMSIIGKRAYNQDFRDKEGIIRVKLIIE
ncbi:MAG: hypothetical protein AAFO07_14190 [Bacteroidota bacterium]